MTAPHGPQSSEPEPDRPDEQAEDEAFRRAPGTIDILQRMADGDPHAIGALYQLYEKRILASVKAKAGAHILARIEPEDLKQEVIRRSLARIKEFRPDDIMKLRWWFQRLADEVAADEARKWNAGKRSAHNEVSMHDDRSGIDPSAGDPTPSRVVAKGEFMASIAACMQELPEHYREVLELRVQRQLPFREIAGILGISEENAAMRETRAMAKLRECLRRRGELA